LAKAEGTNRRAKRKSETEPDAQDSLGIMAWAGIKFPPETTPVNTRLRFVTCARNPAGATIFIA
jgi:hypothetical protein